MTQLRKQSDGSIKTSNQLFSELRASGVSFNETVFNFPGAGYDVVFPAPQPTYDPITQGVREVAPELVNGHWEQRWEVVVLDAAQVTANQAAKVASDAKKVADKIQALWSAANDYTTSYISGVAIGILTVGVIQNKTKCLTVAGWSGAVWHEYYVRKAAVTADSVVNLDFSSFGTMPFSVPELQAEVGM